MQQPHRELYSGCTVLRCTAAAAALDGHHGCGNGGLEF
jgi:hypothetical protein